MASKEIRQLVRNLERAGWRVTLGTGGHYKAFVPDGETIVTFSSTPSDRRALASIIARLRRAGYQES